ncbi:39S ribosomal protein L15, mitochondrial [Trichonephila inaurata madagascariensis]|uniref:Large ribosomal subunit protein uL15m n=1 Tax=Trichonephila inaurata madagascariensis TaxID=2747483 RepID=A0A8X6YF37_9ARAC|nr:39S ribosomal protein L15, mitochondrial [Trichonephila inaurata madagascariensis]
MSSPKGVSSSNRRVFFLPTGGFFPSGGVEGYTAFSLIACRYDVELKDMVPECNEFHIKAPLLRIVRISGDAEWAQYDRPYYVPVFRQYSNNIEIEIRLNSGGSVPFRKRAALPFLVKAGNEALRTGTRVVSNVLSGDFKITARKRSEEDGRGAAEEKVLSFSNGSDILNSDDFEYPKVRARGQHGGTTHGHGNKGSNQRCSYPRAGFEGYDTPFYLKMPMEFYYSHFRGKRQYPPLSLGQLQLMIDTGRVDASQPIDLTTLVNTKIYKMDPIERHFGVHLTDEGADAFTAKINIEVQHAKETAIAAVERNGGVITTAYYDIDSVIALVNPQKFFEKSKPIPLRKLPPEDAIPYYTDPKSRGYLSDPKKILMKNYPLGRNWFEMLTTRKDPRQVFLGLEPGWVVNLVDKVILRPTDEVLQEYYNPQHS